MRKNPKRKNVDLRPLQIKRLYQGVAIINQSFAKEHIEQIVNLHAWDYGFWLKYLDLQRQALKLKPIFGNLDEQAENRQYQLDIKILKTISEEERLQQYQKVFDQAYQPVVDQIIAFWQTYPVTIYGSQIYLHAMAKTFFNNKISLEEPQQGRQIKQALNDLHQRNWDSLRKNLLQYNGWWN